MWVCEYVSMWVCEYVSMWVCEYPRWRYQPSIEPLSTVQSANLKRKPLPAAKTRSLLQSRNLNELVFSQRLIWPQVNQVCLCLCRPYCLCGPYCLCLCVFLCLFSELLIFLFFLLFFIGGGGLLFLSFWFVFYSGLLFLITAILASIRLDRWQYLWWSWRWFWFFCPWCWWRLLWDSTISLFTQCVDVAFWAALKFEFAQIQMLS